MVIAIPGGNLLVLNFAYHLPNPWTDLLCPLNARFMHPTFSHNTSSNSFSGGRVGDSPSSKRGWDPLPMPHRSCIGDNNNNDYNNKLFLHDYNSVSQYAQAIYS